MILAVCCGEESSSVLVFDVANGRQLCSQKVHDEDTYSAAAFFSDSRKLAFGGMKGTFYVMDTEDQGRILTIVEGYRVQSMAAIIQPPLPALVSPQNGTDGSTFRRVCSSTFARQASGSSPDSGMPCDPSPPGAPQIGSMNAITRSHQTYQSNHQHCLHQGSGAFRRAHPQPGTPYENGESDLADENDDHGVAVSGFMPFISPVPSPADQLLVADSLHRVRLFVFGSTNASTGGTTSSGVAVNTPVGSSSGGSGTTTETTGTGKIILCSILLSDNAPLR
ncbi:unnamed protein product [Protopolystoma xenopodis]|uniref:Uncharacterized protein n=1 Tax=Protopolystoma xenopodis TaxID=117903 RepID=A0A3S4ZWW6_9PLAT|nr:unnamed protein product [Protopolystoma xenopodis]